MAYLGTQPNDVKKNTGLYTPSEILQLTKDGSWGGSLELIEEQTASSSSATDFTSILETKYDVHFLEIINATISTTATIRTRFFESGVLETASVYHHAQQYGYSGGGFGEERSTGTSGIYYTSNTINTASNSYIYFYNLGNSAKYSFCTFHTVAGFSTSNQAIFRFGGGVLPQASTVDGIRVYPTSGTFSADIKLYGVKQI